MDPVLVIVLVGFGIVIVLVVRAVIEARRQQRHPGRRWRGDGGDGAQGGWPAAGAGLDYDASSPPDLSGSGGGDAPPGHHDHGHHHGGHHDHGSHAMDTGSTGAIDSSSSGGSFDGGGSVGGGHH